MAKRVKTNYDRGYVNAMDKIRVFIESSSKVMYVDRERQRIIRYTGWFLLLVYMIFG